jgi:glycosyltransferase involved in cell wall biosynthesis
MITVKSSASNLSQVTHKPLRVLIVTGIYPTEDRPHKGTFVKSQVDSLVAAGVEVEILHPQPGPVLLRYLWTIGQVWQKTRTKQFDIVNGHYGQWCLFARLQWHTPVVATFLGSDLLGVPLDYGKYSKLHALNARISRWLCGRVDAAIVQSEEMRRAVGRGSIFLVPNGVDFELFRPIARAEARAALGWDQDRYYVLFGNNPAIPLKGFKLGQAAIERLQAKGVAVELVVANGLPQTKVVQYINASNALILPSLCEGSPSIVKEAMACNIPVVATAVGDVAEVIGQTQGCSVCTQDPDDLAAGIERALQHTGSTTGRSDISHLECSVVAKQVIAVYDAVLQKRNTTITSSVQGEVYDKDA